MGFIPVAASGGDSWSPAMVGIPSPGLTMANRVNLKNIHCIYTESGGGGWRGGRGTFRVEFGTGGEDGR